MGLTKNIYYLGLKVANFKDLINYLAPKWAIKHWILPSYREAILEREIAYPTALHLEKVNVAIPHVDSEHNLENKIIYVQLQDPIEMTLMADTKKVLVRHFFFLIISHKEEFLNSLASLITLFQSASFQNDLALLNDEKAVQKFLEKYGE